MRFIAAALLAASCCSAPAFADRASDAREHYQNATAHFAVGEFADAATEYQAAFKLKPDPALLFNAAQSYRLANNPDKALILYKNYLQLYPDQPNVEEVRQQIAHVQSMIEAEHAKPKAPPPPAATEPAPSTAAPAPKPPDVKTPEPAPLTAPPPTAVTKRETPVYKKWWIWTIVGVVVAGGAVTTAVLLTRPSSHWSNAPDVGPGSSNALVRW